MIHRAIQIIRNRFAVFLHDLAWVPFSIFLAFWIRFNTEIPGEFLNGLLWMLVVALPIHTFLFWYFGLYRGVWRFASIPDLVRVFNAVFVGVLSTLLAIFVLQRAEGVPRLVFFLYPMVLAAGLALPRIAYRWTKDYHFGAGGRERQRALIVGTGPSGEYLVRNLIRSGLYMPVGLVDANPSMKGKEIHGVRVVGILSDLASVIRRLDIEMVLLARPALTFHEWNDVIKVCAAAKVKSRTIADGEYGSELPGTNATLRPITAEDLLYREPVTLGRGELTNFLRGKRVLITGAGGSIGSELCRQVASQKPELLLGFDNSEFNLFQIDQDLTTRFSQVKTRFVLGNVRDRNRVEWLFKNFKPEVIFHAAAYKHVPLLENNPIQAVQNNVFGTKVMAGAADRFGCESFVLISTDKAVNPANIMGVSKRISEIYCQNLNSRSKTRFVTTRFGNVLRSAGSVVPLFERQIADGGPVTVTHPEISRFFMTITEAVSLILQAGSLGKGGEIFVLDMGHPIKIKELAEQMIRLAGYEPYRDIAVVFTGLRAGEKLSEELFHESEGLIGTGHPKLLLAAYRQLNWDWLNSELHGLAGAIRQGSVPALMSQLKTLVPEFRPRSEEPPAGAQPGEEVKLTLVKS